MTRNHAPASATPPRGKQATRTRWPGRAGTAPDTHGTGPAPRRRRRAAVLAMLAVPLAVTALTAIPAAAATGPYAVAATIGVGNEPVAVAVNPSTHTAYVVNQGNPSPSGGNSVSVINEATNTVTATLGVGTHPT